MRSRVIFNISVHVGQLSDQDFRLLTDAIAQGGLALEMPWHPNVRRDPEATARAQMRYRQLLDTGMAIVLIPVDGTPAETLAAWVNSWRKPTDHLYISTPFFKAPPPFLNVR